jgi:hypothetical protein
MHLNHFLLEDFTRPTSSTFIVSRKETNILNYICHDLVPKIEITKHIVSCVKKRDKTFFPTESHVNWAMECIGFAFSLPIDYSSVITQAIDIYRNWLELGSEDRPQCIKENESFYQIEIIGHLSLLFVERSGDMHKHAELCKDALILIKELCRTKQLQEKTWNHLLKIFLIMASGLLKNNTVLIKEIAPLLFKTLFEIWFRSNTRKSELWDEINTHMGTWLNNIWVIHHWTAIEIALTKDIIGLIYGTSKPKLQISFRQLQKPFEFDAEKVKLASNKEQSIYFWYQFWQMISQNTISKVPISNEICTELVKSVAKITDEFLLYSRSRNNKSKINFDFTETINDEALGPLISSFRQAHKNYDESKDRVPVTRIDSILSVFGNWLFFYANCDYLYCEKGRAKAIGALCRIFSSDLGPVCEEYAGKFYKTIFYIMKGGVNQIVIKNILKHSTSLLSSDLPGIRILLDKDYLFKAINLQLSDKKSEAKLRGYCYQIASSFSGLINYLNKSEIIKSFYDLLLDAVQNESDPKNFNALVWIISSFVGTMSSQNELINNIIIALTNRLKNINDEPMYLELLSVLSTVPFLIYNKTETIKNTANRIIGKLCSYVKRKIQKSNERVLSSLLFTVQKWIGCFPMSMADAKLRLDVLDVLSTTKLIEGIEEKSAYIEEFITCNIGKIIYTAPLGPINELIVPRGYTSNPPTDPKNYIIYNNNRESFNNSLLSLYEDDKELIGIFRNRTGRFIWKVEIKYSNIVDKKEYNWNMEVAEPVRKFVETQEKDLHIELDDSEAEILQKLKHLHNEQKKHHKKSSVKLKTKKFSYREAPSKIRPRVFLTQLGLFEYDQIHEISYSDSEIANKIIPQLDKFCEKDIYFLPILFLNSSVSSDFLSQTDNFSKSFEIFLNQLGVILDERHLNLGFLSHLSMYLEKYGTVLYNSDCLHEILSIVPCLQSKEMTIRDVSGDSPVIVIWNEKIDDKHCILHPNLLLYPELQHKICILLVPVKDNLIKVNFFPNTNQPGPLINNMIVPLDVLGKLLTYTLINTYGDSMENITTRQNRKNLLEQLKILGKNEEDSSERMNGILNYSFNLS